MEFIDDEFASLTSGMSPAVSSFHYRFLDEEKKPFLLVLPGGGYCHISGEKEGRVIAEWAESLGFHAGILSYQVQPVEKEKLLQELEKIKKFLQAEEKIDQIFVMGFSAGAHLAGLFSCLGEPVVAGMILAYPVVTFEQDCRHQGSAENFLGLDYTPANCHAYSLENLITATTPPAFIWHTAEDGSVPVKNSLLLAASLAQQQIPFDLHIFPEGHHGLGMLQGTAHTRQWIKLLEHWLQEQRK